MLTNPATHNNNDNHFSTKMFFSPKRGTFSNLDYGYYKTKSGVHGEYSKGFLFKLYAIIDA